MKKGFTLVEIMVTLGIIGLLVVAAVITYSRQQAVARDARRVADIKNIHTALESYISENGEPEIAASDWGTWDISSMPADNPTFMEFLVTSGYMDKTPKDPTNQVASNESALAYYYHYYTSDRGSYGFALDGWRSYVIKANMEVTTPTPFIFHEPVIKDY